MSPKTKDIEVQDNCQDQVSEMLPEETVATLSMKVSGMDKNIAEMRGMMVSMTIFSRWHKDKI